MSGRQRTDGSRGADQQKTEPEGEAEASFLREFMWKSPNPWKVAGRFYRDYHYYPISHFEKMNRLAWLSKMSAVIKPVTILR